MTRHLIHIGYPKTGTTFLQRWFERHPELRYVENGVAGFTGVRQMCVSPDGEFRYYVSSSEGLSAPHSHWGALRGGVPGEAPRAPEPFKEKQAEVCSLLRTLYPGSRILLVTRGFRGLVQSAYSEFVRIGGTLAPAAMCADLAATMADDRYHYFDYDYLVSLYVEAFGEESVIVLPYELLRDDQRRFLEVLEERLGLGHAEIDPGLVHASLSPAELYWYPRISRAVAAAASRVGPAAARRIYHWYEPRLYRARFAPLIAVLRRAGREKEFSPDDLPDDVVRLCHGKATRLRAEPLYAPYAADYLWDA